MRFVPITPPRFDVDLDLRYATADNITGRPIYARPLCLLHPAAADRLAAAMLRARALGLRLRLFDAYRPPAAQWALWRALPDPTFIADPRLGSSHARGVAVDLTLARADGTPLDMGTGFDDMTAAAGHEALDLPPAVLANRALLLGVMVAAGWQPYAPEWWHYNLPDPGRFPLVEDGACAPAFTVG